MVCKIINLLSDADPNIGNLLYCFGIIASSLQLFQTYISGLSPVSPVVLPVLYLYHTTLQVLWMELPHPIHTTQCTIQTLLEIQPEPCQYLHCGNPAGCQGTYKFHTTITMHNFHLRHVINYSSSQSHFLIVLSSQNGDPSGNCKVFMITFPIKISNFI